MYLDALKAALAELDAANELMEPDREPSAFDQARWQLALNKVADEARAIGTRYAAPSVPEILFALGFCAGNLSRPEIRSALVAAIRRGPSFLNPNYLSHVVETLTQILDDGKK